MVCIDEDVACRIVVIGTDICNDVITVVCTIVAVVIVAIVVVGAVVVVIGNIDESPLQLQY